MKIVGFISCALGILSMRGISQPVPSAEYTYDASGNMKADANKNITSIHYNVLNLPDTITYVDGRKVSFSYSASGQKLREVLVSTEGTVVQKRDYVNDHIFRNDTLESIQHSEGRVMPTLPGNQTSGWEYQYHITDHLGNVRMTVTSQTDTVVYQATMEHEQNIDEEIFFDGIGEHRTPFVTANHTPKGMEVARLSNDTEKGVSMNLAVKKGDIIYAQTNAYYEGTGDGDGLQSEQKPLTTILSFVTGFTSGGASVLSESQHSLFTAGSAAGVATGKAEDTEAPIAHLNYQLFNSSFKLIDAGFRAVTKKASFAQEVLEIEPIVVNDTGYLHVYLSNTTEKNVPVYFDDLKVTHILSPIVQEDSYDPFGMTLAEQHDGRPGKIANQHLFNGKELLEDAGLNWYDYGARMYDAALGRWHVTDLMAEKYSSLTPYNYAMNNPVTFIDPDGQDVRLHQAGKDNGRYKKLMTALALLKATDEGRKILSKAENNKDITVYVVGVPFYFSHGSTARRYAHQFSKTRTDWKLKETDIQDIAGTNRFNVFVGLDVTSDVKENKDLYFITINVDIEGWRFAEASSLGHELEAHVNINHRIKKYIKPNRKIDIEIEGKVTEMRSGEVEHHNFGNVSGNPDGRSVNIKGSSADRLDNQLWANGIMEQLTPDIIRGIKNDADNP